jgi:hypothetical protein
MTITLPYSGTNFTGEVMVQRRIRGQIVQLRVTIETSMIYSATEGHQRLSSLCVKVESKRCFHNVTDMIRGTYQVPCHIELQNLLLLQEYIDFKEEHEALKQAAQRKKSKPN